jgi:type I restriction enzyme S subunit
MATSQDFVNWICGKELEYDFLKYLFIAEGEDLLRFASGSVHSTIYFPEVKSFHVCCPSVPEQRRIVGILDKAFESIATAKANAEKNIQNTRALFASHLHKVFYEGGKGWVQRNIDEVASHTLGKMLDKEKNKGELKKYLRNTNVRWFGFDLSNLLEMRFRPEETTRYSAIKGDVLICEGGYPGRAAIWNEEYPVFFQKALHRVRFNERDHNKWFVYYLYALDISGKLKEHFTGTGIQHFTGEVLSRFVIPIAPLRELRQIVDRFDDLFSESLRLESIYQRKIAALDELKKSLLQQAFSGEL